ncbi:sulfotransferase family 2 domain-containing protein [Robertkochia solimangrovi]|uniref:sulfotransferase family 2 domain-containing protein n=1 Tax=Robertkochia solimangrovi TaxID=2213046 RepID=UPI00117CDBA4|nr:sulfotransferase family 2 domain-containing protein [Robertkochia solimangrovi]TRZ44988.1 hypothetical protein DMZ48_04295 [Robertkochia solimangrovi]
MPIDREKQLIFVHIPKVAGTSIEKAFNMYGDHFNSSFENAFGQYSHENETYALQHISIFQLEKLGILQGDKLKKFYSFCFVRNPWDRAVSDFKWHRSVRNKNFKFRAYLKEALNITQQYEKNRTINYTNCHYVPQSWYIYDSEGVKGVDFIGKYESLEKDINFIMTQHKMEEVSLTNSNQGKAIPYVFYFLDIRNIFLISKIYREDIKNFNYTFFKSNALKLFVSRVLKKIG